MGEIIKIPDFWTTLLLIFPNGMDIKEVQAKFSQLPSIIAYSEANLTVNLCTNPNDPEYINQKSIHTSPSFTNADINIEPAWDIIPSGGNKFIKCGVFDTGIDWDHEDFGYDGSNLASSKVIKGWDFTNYTDAKTTTVADSEGHGTHCAGIIGAIRNNTKGVAGIAGGNYSNSPDYSDQGVSLYSLKIIPWANMPRPMNAIYDAIVSSAIDNPLKSYNYGLHLSSNSWKFDETNDSFSVDIGKWWYSDTNIFLIKEAVHFANRTKVTFCAARGNEGYDNLAYPAIIDDDWVLNVGGTGSDGNFIHVYSPPSPNGSFTASYGHNLDVAAPATGALIKTTLTGGGYSTFDGTSAACPHVAGVVSLLMSYLDSTSSAYKNLSPEDCENIIQLSASDTDSFGYDIKTGWGRLNAGAALKLVEKPWNAVRHNGTSTLQNTFTKSKSLITSNKIIKLTERYYNQAGVWFNRGQYKVNVFKIEATVNHTIGTNDTIKAFWTRPSSSNILENTVGDSLLPRERIKINSCSNTVCNMSGYVYQVFDLSNNQLGWWPFDTALSNANFEYTLLTHNKLAPNSIIEVSESKFGLKLYPNPSSDNQKLIIKSANEDELIIKMFDISGRELKTVFSGKSTENSTSVDIDISFLSSGIYTYEIILGTEKKHLKFIKQ
jgi:subtilisin family serine protease